MFVYHKVIPDCAGFEENEEIEIIKDSSIPEKWQLDITYTINPDGTVKFKLPQQVSPTNMIYCKGKTTGDWFVSQKNFKYIADKDRVTFKFVF